MDDHLSLDQCVERHIYRIRSRNLRIAVFRAPSDFIGIREKFTHRYLDTEIAWDEPYHGTVSMIKKELGVLPDDIEMRETCPTECSMCGGPVNFDMGREPSRRWVCEENGCIDFLPTARTYKPLFDYLEEISGNIPQEKVQRWGL